MSQIPDQGTLVCPETKLPLRKCSLEEAESVVGDGKPFVTRRDGPAGAIGRTTKVMLREDGACAYPIVDDIPVLLAPERLVAPPGLEDTRPRSARYLEAYEEMEFYNKAAQESAAAAASASLPPDIARILETREEERDSFPAPRDLWVDAVYDSAAEWEAYEHLAPLRAKRILQLGGKGTHAVKFLLAGAAEAWVLSPMLAEAAFSLALARCCGVEGRLHCVVGVAEEIPIETGTFDGIYSGGCVHHLITEEAFAECARVLRSGGRLGAAEPWQAPLYGIGTKIFGKREKEVHCRPLTAARMRPFFRAMERAEVIHHGALTRYPLLALSRLGLTLELPTVWSVIRLDDAICSLLPALRRTGSSVALLGTKTVKQSGGDRSVTPTLPG